MMVEEREGVGSEVEGSERIWKVSRPKAGSKANCVLEAVNGKTY
jgi:hypothetical protein